jgi:hypothetical protein
MLKNYQNFDRFQDGRDCIFGSARRNALASWGDDGKRLRACEKRLELLGKTKSK